jgi:RHS repeat-associated protein
MQMPGRNASTGDYRFGFKGMEGDDEMKGDGNSYDFGARMYDPRLGRWMSPDPITQFHSPYVGIGNNPIIGKDGDGRSWIIVIGAGVGGIVNGWSNWDKYSGYKWRCSVGLGAGEGAIISVVPVAAVIVAPLADLADQRWLEERE